MAEMAVVLGKLVAAFPNVNFPRASVLLYGELLGDIPGEVLDAAVMQVIARHVYNTVPSVAEIRNMAFEIARGEGDVLSAYAAWEEVKRALHEARPEQHVWSNPLVEKAINGVGGIRAFGQSDVDDEVSWRAQFVRAYESFVQRAANEARMLPGVRAVVERLAGEGERKRIGEG